LNIDWGLWFERPRDLVFSGGGPGAPGAELGVGVDHRDPNRLIFTVNDGGRSLLAVVEAPDAPAFRVISQGSPGFFGEQGQRGYDGSRGPDGSPASCPGSPGGNGGAGGPGGNGG